jgi:hypothetical protein
MAQETRTGEPMSKLPVTIHETSLTLDHDTGELLVDTNDRGMAGKLRRAGFEELPQQEDLFRFRGQPAQLHFRPILKKRQMTDEQRAAARLRLKNLRELDR